MLLSPRLAPKHGHKICDCRVTAAKQRPGSDHPKTLSMCLLSPPLPSPPRPSINKIIARTVHRDGAKAISLPPTDITSMSQARMRSRMSSYANDVRRQSSALSTIEFRQVPPVHTAHHMKASSSTAHHLRDWPESLVSCQMRLLDPIQGLRNDKCICSCP